MSASRWQLTVIMALAVIVLFVSIPSALAAPEDDYEYIPEGGSSTITKYKDTAPGGAVVIPSTLGGRPVGRVAAQAFESRGDVTSVVLPDSVTSVGMYAFAFCTGLTSVTLPDGLKTIELYAFNNCTNLTDIILPAGVTDIDIGAFQSCTNLENMVIPAGMTSISSQLFNGCTSLISVVIPDSVVSIGDFAFLKCSSLQGVFIPESVTEIGDGAFRGCANLERVVLPHGLTSIREYTFYECSGLTSVVIPSGVTNIGSYAFSDCTELHAATFLGNEPSMGGTVFGGSADDFTVYFPKGRAGWPTPPMNWLGYDTGYTSFASNPIQGDNRYATAVAASKKAFPAGSRSVVIATGENWPDALGGAALAGALDCPILLTPKGSLWGETKTEIGRLRATHVIVLGGIGAVSTKAYDEIKGVTKERLAGTNRYETATKVAARTIAERGAAYDHTAFIATGMNFPDALGASPLAAAKGWPIYLSNPAQGDNAALIETMKSNGVTRALVLGGKTVVSDPILTNASTLGSAKRLSGTDRYTTAIDVATYGVTNAGLTWDKLAIATGTNFPDALAGGALQGRSGSVMLLTPGAALNGSVGATLDAHKVGIFEARFLGGPSAVSQSVRASVTNILKK